MQMPKEYAKMYQKVASMLPKSSQVRRPAGRLAGGCKTFLGGCAGWGEAGSLVIFYLHCNSFKVVRILLIYYFAVIPHAVTCEVGWRLFFKTKTVSQFASRLLVTKGDFL